VLEFGRGLISLLSEEVGDRIDVHDGQRVFLQKRYCAGTSGTPQKSRCRGVAEDVDFGCVLVNAADRTWSFRASAFGLTRVPTTSHF